jgi:glycosyltransferase involved in cell wall biosynthesis
MRIAVVTSHWPPRLSGVGDYAWHLAAGLVKAGDDVIVSVLGHDDVKPLSGAAVGSMVFPDSPRRLLQVARSVAAREADVVLLQFEANAFRLRTLPHLLPLALRAAGQRVIVTYHELWRPRHFGRLAKVVLLNSPERVVVSSPWHAAGVDRFRRRRPRADTIGCPTNFPFLTPNKGLLRVRFGIPADTAIIGFFGFILPEHGVDVLLAALGSLVQGRRRVMLSVIGEFEPRVNGYHQRLLAMATDLDLSDLVTWHGRVSEPDAVARLLSVCDLGILPYDSGVGENNTAFAAFADAGVPVVTTRGERSSEMEAEGVALFADARAGELAAVVARVLDDRDLAAKVATRAQAWSARRNWQRVIAGYHAVLTPGSATVDIR